MYLVTLWRYETVYSNEPFHFRVDRVTYRLWYSDTVPDITQIQEYLGLGTCYLTLEDCGGLY